jgi:hypothetical protein
MTETGATDKIHLCQDWFDKLPPEGLPVPSSKAFSRLASLTVIP